MGLDVLIWGFGIAVFGVAARRAVEMIGQQRWKATWAWFFVSFVPLGIASQVWAAMNNPPPTTRWIILGFAGATIGATLFIAVGEAVHSTANAQGPPSPTTTPSPAPVINQGPGSAYSSGQQGGITAGTINIAPGRLAFSSQLGEQLLERMPNRTKKVEMQVVGGKSDQAVGDDIYRYLLQSGYQQVDRGTPIGMLMDVQGAPDGPIYVMEDPSKYVLVVKPSAH